MNPGNYDTGGCCPTSLCHPLCPPIEEPGCPEGTTYCAADQTCAPSVCDEAAGFAYNAETCACECGAGMEACGGVCQTACEPGIRRDPSTCEGECPQDLIYEFSVCKKSDSSKIVGYAPAGSIATIRDEYGQTHQAMVDENGMATFVCIGRTRPNCPLQLIGEGDQDQAVRRAWGVAMTALLGSVVPCATYPRMAVKWR